MSWRADAFCPQTRKELYARRPRARSQWKDYRQGGCGTRKAALAASSVASNVEQWAVNKAVHYKRRANFGREDFEPVVAAFRELLNASVGQVRLLAICDAARKPESLRCACNEVSLNLKAAQMSSPKLPDSEWLHQFGSTSIRII
jgi:hypothetical protein